MSVRGFNTGSGVEQYDYEYLDNKPEIPTKKSDIGLGNVDNTSDLDKPISNATQTALNEKVPNTRKVNGKALSADITLTSGDIDYDGSTAYDTGTVGKELTELNRQISDVEENQIPELKSSVSEIDNGNVDILKIASNVVQFTMGLVSSSGSVDDTRKDKIRFKERIFVKAGSSVSVDSSDYKFNLALYNAKTGGELIEFYSMRPGDNPITINQDCYILSSMGKISNEILLDTSISSHYKLNLIKTNNKEFTTKQYNDRLYLKGIGFAPINEQKAIFENSDSAFNTFSESSVPADLYNFIDSAIAAKNAEDEAISSGYSYAKKSVYGMDESNTYQLVRYLCSSPLGSTIDDVINFSYDKPTIIIVATQHGDEKGAAFACAHLIDMLTNKWESNEVLEYLHWNVNLVIYPCANPWGMVNNSYVNSNGINLNRNWPYNFIVNQTQGSDNTGASPLSARETSALNANLLSFKNVVHIIDFHMNKSTISNPQWNGLCWIPLPTESELYNTDIFNTVNRFGYKLSRQFNKEYNLGFADAKKLYYISQSSASNMLKGYGGGVLHIPSITLEGSCKTPNDSEIYTAQTNKMNTELLANWLYNICLEYSKYDAKKQFLK